MSTPHFAFSPHPSGLTLHSQSNCLCMVSLPLCFLRFLKQKEEGDKKVADRPHPGEVALMGVAERLSGALVIVDRFANSERIAALRPSLNE